MKNPAAMAMMASPAAMPLRCKVQQAGQPGTEIFCWVNKWMPATIWPKCPATSSAPVKAACPADESTTLTVRVLSVGLPQRQQIAGSFRGVWVTQPSTDFLCPTIGCRSGRAQNQAGVGELVECMKPPKFNSAEEVRREWIAANFSGHILDDAAHENHSKERYEGSLLCRSKTWPDTRLLSSVGLFRLAGSEEPRLELRHCGLGKCSALAGLR